MKASRFYTATAVLGAAVASGIAAESEVQLFESSLTVVIARKSGHIDTLLAGVGEVLEKGDAMILLRGNDPDSHIRATHQGQIKRYGPNVKADGFLESGDFVAELQSKRVYGLISLDVNSVPYSQLKKGRYCCIIVNEQPFTIQISGVATIGENYVLNFSSHDQISSLMKHLESKKAHDLDISFQLKQGPF